MTANRKSKPETIKEGKIFALLAYLSILCIIPLVLKKENDFVLSHGKQGLVLFIGEVIIFIISMVPFLSWMLKTGLFILFVLSLWGMIEVLKGRYIKLPIVAEIAEKITL